MPRNCDGESIGGVLGVTIGRKVQRGQPLSVSFVRLHHWCVV
jgi:hypothetical protein